MGVGASSHEDTAAVVEDYEKRSWEGLQPDILSSIFVRIPLEERLWSLLLVCKPWMEVVMDSFCWRDIDIQAWCRWKHDGHAVDRLVEKLIQQSNFEVQRLSVYNMGETGFLSVVNCESLKVLEIPWSLSDDIVLKHLKPLPNLTILNINYCSKIGADGVAAFGEKCKSLIHLKRCIPPQEERFAIDDSEAMAISDTMRNVEHLELCFGRFGDSGLFKILENCKALKHLDIRGCWNVKLNGDVKKMCEKLENFRIHNRDFSEKDRRDLVSCYRMTDRKECDVFVELEAQRNRNRQQEECNRLSDDQYVPIFFNLHCSTFGDHCLR